MKKINQILFISLISFFCMAGIGMIAWQWPNIKQWWNLEGQFKNVAEDREVFWKEHGYYPMDEGESLVNDIPEEDFTTIEEKEKTFGDIFKPLPSNEVAIEEGGKNTVINNIKEGYLLTLPPDYKAGTWEVESDTVGIGHDECAIDLDSIYGRNDNYEVKIENWLKKETEDDDENFQDYVIEKIQNIPIDAYRVYAGTPFCFPAEFIFMEGKNRIYRFGRNSCDYSGCEVEIDTILNNIKFFDPDKLTTNAN